MPKYGKVDHLPFYEGVLTQKKLKELINENVVGKQPRCMDYRKEFIKGNGGNTKEKTWDREQHIHVCCHSKVPWRHKVKCPRKKEEGNAAWQALGE